MIKNIELAQARIAILSKCRSVQCTERLEGV